MLRDEAGGLTGVWLVRLQRWKKSGPKMLNGGMSLRDLTVFLLASTAVPRSFLDQMAGTLVVPPNGFVLKNLIHHNLAGFGHS